MYADDHQYLPHDINRYWGNKAGYGNYRIWETDGNWYNHGLLWDGKYIQAPKIFACPDDPIMFGSGSASNYCVGARYFYEHNGEIAYYMNPKPPGVDYGIHSSYIMRGLNPEHPNAADNDPIHFRMLPESKYGFITDQFVSGGHGHDKLNTLYTDGHVETVFDASKFIIERVYYGYETSEDERLYAVWDCLDAYRTDGDYERLLPFD